MASKLLRSCIILAVLTLTAISSFAQESTPDSVTTAFRKGRWLTGLSGSISSSSTKLDTASVLAFTNQYSFDFSTGKFFKDRWLLGGIFKMQRDNSRQFIDLESESLLVAPLLSFYLSDSPQGSLFFSVAPGYASFRERTVILVGGTPTKELLKGTGFGLFANMGYSFVLHDRIVFDLGLGLNSLWTKGTRELEPGKTSEDIRINTGSLLFSFGFNVILDQFFF